MDTNDDKPTNAAIDAQRLIRRLNGLRRGKHQHELMQFQKTIPAIDRALEPVVLQQPLIAELGTTRLRSRPRASCLRLRSAL